MHTTDFQSKDSAALAEWGVGGAGAQEPNPPLPS